jgi:hypothetical protein
MMSRDQQIDLHYARLHNLAGSPFEDEEYALKLKEEEEAQERADEEQADGAWRDHQREASE